MLCKSRTLKPMLVAAVLAALLVAGCGGPSEKSLITDAVAAMDKPDTAAAIVHLKTLLQNNPDAMAGRFLLGKALLLSGDAAGATVELEKVMLAKYPVDEVVPLLAEALLASGQHKKLVDTLSSATVVDAKAAARLKVSLGAAQITQGNAAAGRQLVDAALQLEPKNVDARLLKARLVAGGGGFDEAVGIADTVLADQPGNARAWGLKGELLWLGKADTDAGAAALRKAVALEPGYSAAHSSLISLLLQQNDIAGFKAEVAALKKAIPGHPDTLFFDAQLALHEQETQRGRDLVQKLLGFAPENPYTLQLAGAIELQAGALVAAETFLNKALSKSPALVLARRLLADTYLRGAQPAKALAVLQPLLGQARPHGEALALAAAAYLQSGKFEKAEESYAAAALANPRDTKVRTALALARVARGNADAGFAQLESLATADTGSYPDLALISARMRRNELDAALQAVNRLQAKLSGMAQPHHLRGQILMAKKDPAGARASFQKALDIDPVFLPSVGALAAMDVTEKKLPDALKRYHAVVAKDPKNATALIAVAALREQLGAKPEEVSALLDDAIKASPDDLTPRLAKIEHLLSRHQVKAALGAAQDATSQFRDSASALDALGRAQIAAGDQKQAISSFHKVALLEPTSEQPYLRLAEAYLIVKDYPAASQNFTRALEIRPGMLGVQRRLIQLALLDKRVDEAIRIARKIQKEQPSDPVGVLMESEVHVGQRSWDAAIGVLQAALARSASSELAKRLHLTYGSANRPAEAATFAARWQRDHPRDAEFLFHLGSVAVDRADLAAAEGYFRRVMALVPDHSPSTNNVAWLMLKQGKPGAWQMAARANELAPGQPKYLDTLAQAYAAEQRWSDAIAAQKRAVELASDAASYRLALAKLLIGAGDTAAAKTELIQLQSMGANFGAQSEVTQLLQTL